MQVKNLALLSLLCLQPLSSCQKRSEIESKKDSSVASAGSDPIDLDKPALPVSSAEWKSGNPEALLGNWASSLFLDQRCTAFYTFAPDAIAELNLICLNPNKKQFEREYRRYATAQYAGSQQIRLKQVQSSCKENDSKNIHPDGVAFLFVLEAEAQANQTIKMVLWEPVVKKSPLNLSRSDGLMAEGFPGKTGTYLGMPVINGCFTDGLVANFTVLPTP